MFVDQAKEGSKKSLSLAKPIHIFGTRQKALRVDLPP